MSLLAALTFLVSAPLYPLVEKVSLCTKASLVSPDSLTNGVSTCVSVAAAIVASHWSQNLLLLGEILFTTPCLIPTRMIRRDVCTRINVLYFTAQEQRESLDREVAY